MAWAPEVRDASALLAVGTKSGHVHFWRVKQGHADVVHCGEAAAGTGPSDGHGVRRLAWAGDMLAVALDNGAVAVHKVSMVYPPPLGPQGTLVPDGYCTSCAGG
jgi:hypothetical protein